MSANFIHAQPPLADRAKAAAGRFIAWLHLQPLFLVAFAAAAAMGLADILVDPSRLATALGDTDDATRLTQIRELLAGHPWFDMTLARFGGSEPLVSHWSRIIDLPIAAMITLFSTVLGTEHAEFAARALWPTLLSGVIVSCIAWYCETLASRTTALLAIALAAPCTGHFQFVPGRIDHHSAMIIGAVGGTLVLLAAIDRPKLGWFAGLMLGVGCAVGYEGLILTLAALAIVTLSAIATNANLGGPARASAAFAATLSLCWFVFGPGLPDGRVVCDALSTNLIALAVCGAVGVGLANQARLEHASAWVSFVYAAVPGIVGLVLYGIAEPVCLGGPFAQVEPRLGPVWLSHVSETRSLFALAGASLSDMFSVAAYPLVAVAYGLLVVRGRHMPHAKTMFTIFLVTLLLGLYQVKLLPYASYLCVPLIAIGLTRPAVARAPVARNQKSKAASPLLAISGGLAAVFLASVILATVVLNLSNGSQAGTPGAPVETNAGGTGDFQSCTNAENIKPLAGLSHALAANDIDLGPYLVAWTSLDVLSAPYHRLGRPILSTHDLFHASKAEAKARMQRLGATYVIVCAALNDTAADSTTPGDSLRVALLAGAAPEFLEPVAIGKGNVKVWRLKAD